MAARQLEPEARLQHADDRVVVAVELDRPADDPRLRREVGAGSWAFQRTMLGSIFAREVAGMAQVALYLDEKIARRVAAAAKRERVSRSAWIRGAVEAKLAGRLPDSFFAVLGAWEDSRQPDEIVAAIRRDSRDQERERLT